MHLQAPSHMTQQQPSQGGRREASTATASRVHMATGSEQSRRPRRVHTMGSTIGTWPEMAIHENEMGSNGKEKRVKRGERSGCTGGCDGGPQPAHRDRRNLHGPRPIEGSQPPS